MKLLIEKLLVSLGIGGQIADGLAVGLLFALIALGAYLVYWMLRNYLLKLIHKVTLKTTNQWDDALMESGVFHRFMRLIPLTFIMLCFDRAMPGDQAEPLFDQFVDCVRAEGIPVETGVFGAMMDVELVNSGPVTLLWEDG